MTRLLLILGTTCILVFFISIGFQVTGMAQVPDTSIQPNMTIPYSGILSDKSGNMSPDGSYDLSFSLYKSEIGGEPYWTELHEDVMVEEGEFFVTLGNLTGIPSVILENGEHWLTVSVRASDEKAFTVLDPRQRLNASSPELSATQPSSASCAHDHFDENWVGTTQFNGLRVENNGYNAITGVTSGDDTAIVGIGGDGQYGTGVYGVAKNGEGVYGRTETGWGVYGAGDNGIGVYGTSSSSVGVYASGGGGTKSNPALRAHNANSANGMAAYLTNESSYHTAHFQNTGKGGVLFLQNAGDTFGVGGGEFITAVNGDGSDPQFRVQSDGQAFADGGWQGAADFAELMTVEGKSDEYEPGDVLVINTDSNRTVELSKKPFSTLVIGVYSENPGFIGSSHTMESQREDEIPVAVMGIVPCKVTTENGPIHRGDLLVTSSLPAHAMRAIDPPQGTILGKALEDLDATEEVGIIQILVMLQ